MGLSHFRLDNADYLDEEKRENGGGKLPDDIQAKVNKMKIVTVNVPSKAEHQGDATLYPSLRSFYARFLFSEKFREFNTATACERILSHITTDDSQNILIMQVNDDPVVSPELQLFNKVDPLIALTRKKRRNVINRVMFRVINKKVELQDGTFKNVNELVHHNVPWQYMRLWNRNRNEKRNPYHGCCCQIM
ncbi:MAG: hypothetical protein GY821_11365 [Gammaproteobacteria bacterium]|nr:hypothetical protein [Gammaproteobacteria bacterium]